ncbi:uncharacterized protein LOC117638920 [Thrips palmi]|uniref:Uncharacterized protein LOC117638920 n=1 Tax=Thrips palmi TaxID=161013 RepID=A0A6P8Y8J3_THRPL|nr:uncharacterized protein LOC117638920 [Thrips palmi]
MAAAVLPAVLLLCLLHGAAAFSGGPVYVGPQGSSPAAPKPAAVDPGLQTTQTVYGFLDFTTTIGNTVMVFSPQSAPAHTTQAPATTAAPVIETRPAAAPPAPAAIQPSKPTATKQPAVLSSVVEVRGGEAPVDKVDGPILSSVVEVREGPAPSASPAASPAVQRVVFSSVVEVKEAPAPRILSSIVEVKEAVSVAPPKVLSSVVQVVGGDSPAPSVSLPAPKVSVLTSSHDEPAISGNNLVIGPEYDFLSRQPSEVVDETYKVIDLRPSAKHKTPGARSRVNVVVSSHVAESPALPPSGPPAPAPSGPHKPHPTGLVTKLGGTVVKEGVTTVHETSVIGTFISGKYAQVLESTSHVIQPKQKAPAIKPTAASQARILKTAAPTAKQLRHNLDPTPAASVHEETAVLPLEALFSQPGAACPPLGRRLPKNDFKARFGSGSGRAGRLGGSREVDATDGEQDIQEQDIQEDHDDSQGPSYKSKQRQRGFSPAPRPGGRPRAPAGPSSSEQQESTPQPPGSRRYQQSPRKNFRNSAVGSNSIQQESSSGHTRRGYKPRLHTSAVDQETHFEQTEGVAAASTGSSSPSTIHKFKLSRPNGRWQYKTTPKPRINIRRQDGDTTPAPPALQQAQQLQELGTSFSTSVSSSSSSPNNVTPEQGELETAASDDPDAPEHDAAAEDAVEPQPAQETIKVQISTPADFRDTYYEIATIRSPYTFQVGNNKNTRFITVTSTFERTLEPSTTVEPSVQPTLSPSEPLTENILASTTAAAYDKRLALEAATLATLPPIALAPDQATPPLQTETETFSTTQVLLKTHILPVVRGPQNTTLYTLVQTYSVTRLVTAIKTLPPMEVYQFVPSKTLTDLNTRLDEAGSELHLELDFGDDGNAEDDDENPAAVMARIAPDLDLANVGQEFDPSDVDRQRPKKAHQSGSPANAVQSPTEAPTTPPPSTPNPNAANPALSPEHLQQLALLRFLNPQAAAALGPQVITTSKPVIKVETLYESHVIPVFNGLVTSLSTLSRPVSTVTRTEFELATSTALPPPGLPPQGLQQLPQLPLFPQPNQFQVTSSPLVTQTMVTQTDSKVLKLTFGAKTAYTTLFSTRVVPTLLTTYLTANVPVQPTAAPFPGYFPAPFPSYPYVG